ncbi:MAG: HlyC/CorC family transporter [Lachnospiraceae bacterium]|nr:HlyC/CorC family transporter [Lachnospiraceae bacterium]
MEGHPIRGFVLILGLVALNAVVSAAEAAIENLNESSVRKKAEENDKSALKLVKLLDMPHRYINVIEILITLASLLIGMIYSFAQYNFIRNYAGTLFKTGNVRIQTTVSMIVVTILLTYFVVLFGMLLPKKLATKYADSWGYSLANLLEFFSRLFSPAIWLLEKNTKLLLRIFRINPDELLENVTEEEIISMVNEGQEQGVLEAGEAEMISNIIEFNEKAAKDIMTHRKKIVAISTESTIEEALKFMLGENYSRFPLYQENIDDIVGVLHLKDVMFYYVNPDLRKKPLTCVAREPYFIPDTQGIDVLFHDMQSKKIHMAIAIDEYGQTAGLVAMEDILEEIVGDIQDEYDEEEEDIVEQKDKTYLVKGDASLEDLEDSLGIEIAEEDKENYDTLNGLLISRLEHIPTDGERATIPYGGYDFEILEVNNKMIDQVRIVPHKEENAS